MYSFYELVWIFLIYAFVGWTAEVAFAALVHGKFVNRGFLNGPVCPIYGFGVLAVVTLLDPLKDNFLLLFAGSVLLTSALEYITGFVLEKIFRDKWWDYSAEPFNIKGYICLRFSLMWGFACIIVIDAVHPAVMGVVSFVPKFIGIPLMLALAAVLICDLILTMSAASKMLKRLKMMDELSAKIRSVSDSIGAPLAEKTLTVKEKIDEKKPEAEALKEEIKQFAENPDTSVLKEKGAVIYRAVSEKGEEFIHSVTEKNSALLTQLEEKLQSVASETKKTEARFLKSFPRLQSGVYSDSVEKIKKYGTHLGGFFKQTDSVTNKVSGSENNTVGNKNINANGHTDTDDHSDK